MPDALKEQVQSLRDEPTLWKLHRQAVLAVSLAHIRAELDEKAWTSTWSRSPSCACVWAFLTEPTNCPECAAERRISRWSLFGGPDRCRLGKLSTISTADTALLSQPIRVPPRPVRQDAGSWSLQRKTAQQCSSCSEDWILPTSSAKPPLRSGAPSHGNSGGCSRPQRSGGGHVFGIEVFPQTPAGTSPSAPARAIAAAPKALQAARQAETSGETEIKRESPSPTGGRHEGEVAEEEGCKTVVFLLCR